MLCKRSDRNFWGAASRRWWSFPNMKGSPRAWFPSSDSFNANGSKICWWKSSMGMRICLRNCQSLRSYFWLSEQRVQPEDFLCLALTGKYYDGHPKGAEGPITTESLGLNPIEFIHLSLEKLFVARLNILNTPPQNSEISEIVGQYTTKTCFLTKAVVLTPAQVIPSPTAMNWNAIWTIWEFCGNRSTSNTPWTLRGHGKLGKPKGVWEICRDSTWILGWFPPCLLSLLRPVRLFKLFYVLTCPGPKSFTTHWYFSSFSSGLYQAHSPSKTGQDCRPAWIQPSTQIRRRSQEGRQKNIHSTDWFKGKSTGNHRFSRFSHEI